MEGIGHAIAVIGDLITLGHLKSATITCNCESEDGPHVVDLWWDPVANDVMVKPIRPGAFDA